VSQRLVLTLCTLCTAAPRIFARTIPAKVEAFRNIAAHLDSYFMSIHWTSIGLLLHASLTDPGFLPHHRCPLACVQGGRMGSLLPMYGHAIFSAGVTAVVRFNGVARGQFGRSSSPNLITPSPFALRSSSVFIIRIAVDLMSSRDRMNPSLSATDQSLSARLSDTKKDPLFGAFPNSKSEGVSLKPLRIGQRSFA